MSSETFTDRLGVHFLSKTLSLSMQGNCFFGNKFLMILSLATKLNMIAG